MYQLSIRVESDNFFVFFPQIRGLQTENEDSKTEIDLLKRRIEQLKKRRDFTLDT